MARKRKSKAPVMEYGRYLSIPFVVLHSERFIGLSPKALKLLIDIARQFNGYNNGDLQATKSYLSSYGWSGNSCLTKAKKELLGTELIIQTRWGGMNMGCDLFAISWQPIHECGGKLEVEHTTNPPVDWLKEESKMQERRRLERNKRRKERDSYSR